MKKTLILSALAAAAMAVSCNKTIEVATPGLVHFKLTAQTPQTKTSIVDMGDGGYMPVWHENDKIGILFSIPEGLQEAKELRNDAVFVADASADGSTAEFSGVAEVDDCEAQTIYAYYPSTAGQKIYKNGSIGLDIPAEQHPVFVRDNYSFDPTSDLLVAKPHTCLVVDHEAVSNDDMLFTRVSCVVKFAFNAESGSKAYQQHVKSVKLTTEGAHISARVAVDPKTCQVTACNSKTGSTTVTLLPTDDCYAMVSANGGNCLFASVAPVTVKENARIVIEVETDNYTITKTLDTHAAIEFPVGGIFVFNLNITDDECISNEGGGNTKTVSFDNLGYGSWGKTGNFSGTDFASVSQTKDGVVFDYIRNGGSIYANTSAIRFYKSNELKFTAPSGYVITSVEFDGLNWKADATTDVKTCTSTTSGLSWAGSASSVTFTRPSDASSYTTLSSVTVALQEEEGETGGSTEPVTSVSLDKTSASLTVGGSVTLQATVNPETATNKNVTWSSDNTAVATVVDGVVTAVAAGNATITVTTVDGGFKASCGVTVTAPTTVVKTYTATITAASITKAGSGSGYALYNGTRDITAVAADGSTTTVSLASVSVMPGTGENSGKIQFQASKGTLSGENWGTITGIDADDALTVEYSGGTFSVKKTTSGAGYYDSIVVTFTK